MSKPGGFNYSHDAVRVRVKFQKCTGSQVTECRKFSIDPQITSFEVLQSIIAKAFDIKGLFSLNYRVIDDYGQEAFLPLLSDWDLEAAILNASDPHLSINIDMKIAFERALSGDDPLLQPGNDVFGTFEIPRLVDAKPQTRLPGLIMNRVEKTFTIFQKAFNLSEEVSTAPVSPPRPPLTDAEFRKYLDPVGQISHVKELRYAIYLGGVEPSLRKVVWKHILNVYPQKLSGRERMDYIKRKTQEYENLRETWRQSLQQGQANEELLYVTSMVRKDVLRTDRHLKFYGGSDDNQNIASLFNILTTYALNHPSVSYCQGMSDLASPLLVTMCDEAHAYICFCALMLRLKPNFMLDGEFMTQKFQHLTEGLQQCDPEFHAYLAQHQAEDLLFCYRWLLLEMKREFAFDDALHMLEVLWSSIEAVPPVEELPLFEVKFESFAGSPPPIRAPRENQYTKVCALRRQSSSMSLTSLTSNRRIKAHRQNMSLDENVLAKQHHLRKQGHLKPFFSLDDNCMEMHEGVISNSHSASAMHVGEPDPLTLMKLRVKNMSQADKNNTLSSSTGNLMEAGNRRRVASDGNSSCSLNKLTLEKENEDCKVGRVPKGRTVKNFNEFLNLAGRGRGFKPRQRSQCSSISESEVRDSPNIKITRSEGVSDIEISSQSDPDSDRSSIRQHSSPSFSSSMSPNVFDTQPSDDSSPDAETPHGGNISRSDSSPDISAEYGPITTSMTQELKMDVEHLDRKVLEPIQKTDHDVFVWQNPIQAPQAETPDEQIELNNDEIKSAQDEFPTPIDEITETPNFLALTTSNILHSIRTVQIRRSPAQAFCALPPPEVFGGGNPFLMFLCLTLLRQHRDNIMKNRMDYNEMAMHFDKMVRKHNVNLVLQEARRMFAAYLKQHTLNGSQISKNNFKGEMVFVCFEKDSTMPGKNCECPKTFLDA